MTLQQCLLRWGVKNSSVFFKSYLQTDLLDGRFCGECAPDEVFMNNVVERYDIWKYETPLSNKFCTCLNQTLTNSQIKCGDSYAAKIGIKRIQENDVLKYQMSEIAFAIWCGFPSYVIDVLLEESTQGWSIAFLNLMLSLKKSNKLYSIYLNAFLEHLRHGNAQPFLAKESVRKVWLFRFDKRIKRFNILPDRSGILLGESIIDEYSNRFVNL